MALVHAYVPTNGQLLDASEYCATLAETESKFAGNIGLTDMAAKIFRFCLSAAEHNADGDVDKGSIPDNDAGVWWETQLPFAFQVETYVISYDMMKGAGGTWLITAEYSIDDGQTWFVTDSLVVADEGTPQRVAHQPSNPWVPSMARFRLRLGGNHPGLMAPNVVMWCKGYLGEN